jgi:hypothetical protein
VLSVCWNPSCLAKNKEMKELKAQLAAAQPSPDTQPPQQPAPTISGNFATFDPFGVYGADPELATMFPGAP